MKKSLSLLLLLTMASFSAYADTTQDRPCTSRELSKIKDTLQRLENILADSKGLLEDYNKSKSYLETAEDIEWQTLDLKVCKQAIIETYKTAQNINQKLQERALPKELKDYPGIYLDSAGNFYSSWSELLRRGMLPPKSYFLPTVDGTWQYITREKKTHYTNQFSIKENKLLIHFPDKSDEIPLTKVFDQKRLSEGYVMEGDWPDDPRLSHINSWSTVRCNKSTCFEQTITVNHHDKTWEETNSEYRNFGISFDGLAHFINDWGIIRVVKARTSNNETLCEFDIDDLFEASNVESVCFKFKKYKGSQPKVPPGYEKKT